jgi:hypothetical protein
VPLVEASVALWEKDKKYSEAHIFKVIDFFIDVKHFVVFGGHIFQQIVYIPIGIVKHQFLNILFIFSSTEYDILKLELC